MKSKQLDLFITLTAQHAKIKSNRDLMARCWVSLSKSSKRKLIEHQVKDSWIKISSDREQGIATIYDMDVLMFITSLMMDRVNNGTLDYKQRKIRFSGYEYFYFTNKHKSGRADKELQAALERLHTTRIQTSIRSEHKRKLYSSFYWLSEWQKLEENGRAVGYSVVLPDWMFEAVTKPQLVLTLDEEYFHIKGGLVKWLYLFCRKARAHNSTGAWKESFRSIYEKSSMKSPYKTFRKKMDSIISKQSIPNYYLEENQPEILTIHRTRRTLRPNKDEAFLLDGKQQ